MPYFDFTYVKSQAQFNKMKLKVPGGWFVCLKFGHTTRRALKGKTGTGSDAGYYGIFLRVLFLPVYRLRVAGRRSEISARGTCGYRPGR